MCYLQLNFLYKIYVRNTLSISHHIDAIGITGILHVSAKNDGRILFIQLQHVTNAAGLLTGHHGAAAAAKGINDDTVFLTGIADWITQQIQRLAGRMVLIALRFIVVPDSGLLAVRIPWMLSILQEAIQHRLMRH